MNYLSALNRSHLRTALTNNQYDLCIIGGGITGAGIALDAASRGLKVALIEKDDFGSGTSSKSTKLIHGGLRYLKQFEIQLVREVGQERATVHRLAPHLVLPEKMLLPLVKGGTYGPWATSLGLKVYDFLAGVRGDDKRKMLSKKATLQSEPLLSPQGLVGGGYYAEYRTDDARLTIENIKTAHGFGAHCINYVKADEFDYKEGKIVGVKCIDTLNGDAFTIQTKTVISAAGPWVDGLRKKDNSFQGKRLFLSKGVHIVVPFEKLPLKQSIYFDNEDGRMIFAIPRNRATYIGTTDTPYDGDPNAIPIDLEDVQYLLKATNQMFPDIQLEVSDVESSWAGLRPLIYEEGKSASEMSRKDEIFESETGLISIAGGKLTGYRKMAERVLNVLIKKFGNDFTQNLAECKTRTIALAGGLLANTAAVKKYRAAIRDQFAKYGFSALLADYYVANYGKQTDRILEIFNQTNSPSKEDLLLAELSYTLESEMVNTALDFFNRRSGRLYFDLPCIEPNLENVLTLMQQKLSWSSERVESERRQVLTAIKHVSVFSPKKTSVPA